MNLKTSRIMSLLVHSDGGRNAVSDYPADLLTLHDGSSAYLHFFGHASLAIEACGGKWIYIDPVGGMADYAALPKADLILITHSHYDHLDSEAVGTLLTRQTVIVCDRTSSETLGLPCRIMRPGGTVTPHDWLRIEAVAAYNTTEGHLGFHPAEREDCGYVLTLGGTRIYIAGDTEPIPEMRTLPRIDVAFLPVNQPYTMTVDQAVEAVGTIRPRIFYPYHYGQVEERTDTARLVRALQGITEVRLRPME